MAWLRAPTILTLVVFLAFGFQIIGVFSDPVSHDKLPIASRDGYDYGVLGWCQLTGQCSSYGVGYTLQGDTTSRWSDSEQRILSEIMIVHIISAGMLLIGLFMAICTHLRNYGYWIAVEVWLVLSFLGATLTFIVEILLFGTDLKFTGWFSLAGAILSLVSVISMAVMLHNLSHKNPDSTYGSMVEAPGVFEVGSGFRTERDDNKLLKPDVFISTHELPPLPSSKGPVLKKTTVFHGYKKVPDGEDSSLKSVSAQQKSYLPPSTSSESIGAQPGIQEREEMIPNRSGWMSQPSQSPRPSMQQQQQQQQRQQEQELLQPMRPASPASIASTEIGRVPAGAYVHGLEQPEQYGSNVVKIPHIREPESAVIDYHTDETQSRSPIREQKVPNFSRMSAQSGSQGRSPNKNLMLERYMQAESAKANGRTGEPLKDLSNGVAPSLNSGSDSLNNNLVNERNQIQQQVQNQAQDNVRQQTRPQAQQRVQQIPSQPVQLPQQVQQQVHQRAQQQAQQAQPQPTQQFVQQQPYQDNTHTFTPSNLPVMQSPNTYGYGYQGNYSNYQPPSYQTANYGYTPDYNYANGYQGYNQAYSYPRPAPRPPKPQQQRSEFALNSNPDFAIAEMSRRKRFNRGI